MFFADIPMIFLLLFGIRFYIKADVTIDLMRSQQGYLLISMRYLSFFSDLFIFSKFSM
jgi:hypothetical protein